MRKNFSNLLIRTKSRNLIQIMRKIFFLFSISIATLSLRAQTANETASSNTQGVNNLVSFDIYVPVSVFSQSHVAGISLNYSWSNGRYGMNVSPKKIIGFTLNAGADYYFGKKTETAGYDFNYSNYFYLYVMPGLLFNPFSNGNISLLAGPSMGVYKNNVDWGFTAAVNGNYYLTKNISVGPGISYKKHTETDALWSVFVRGSFAF